jgi:hypothetical protein
MKTKLFIIFTLLVVLSLAGCGKETVIKEVLVTTPTTEAPVAPEANKYDSYLIALYENSAQARTWSESDLLELGTTVCQTFDEGGTLDGVITIFSQYSNGKYDDELFSAIIAGSVTFLCPEWADYVSSQLS